ncbi:amino acid permease [Mycolicibacterium mageritense DSM 44476 = CIP 104973]|uniref:Amino acid permease n=1 Tax=Mycolicibacterium mageritense TaxID=53462 RepID=A0AAI8TX80_MYCME|nr:APC family permease [Mycolicibacterium mageritense]MCC9186188.1 APC family permease [Mycolicibacterium mageritense]BBX35626.1 amino acid permease [Mycolicibacterium mageritense]BDY30526.1 putative fructoselysine/psicoselysine transporter FrlA [Mycolicibacterium mageritense]CDO19867.1 cationic amino acid transport integral membrane protein [Mycolicibacterium mageritense DSM 44476 = CIP 104973]
MSASISPRSSSAAVTSQPTLERRIGPLQATAINMTQMCGIGPFVTIPAMVATIGGPEAMFGWIIGAILALADGLIWAELGAAMPGAGGTYLYLREAFQYRTGRLMPFLFVWSAVLFIPLIMSTGIIGLVQYLGYLIPGVTSESGNTALGKVIGVGIVLLIMVALFRKIGQIGKLTTALFVVMLVATLSTIVAAFTHFSSAQAFAFTPGAFGSHGTFWAGLGAGLVIAVYDYLGYNTTAYLGGEVRDPGRTIPRSIVISILGIMSLYFLLQVGVLGSVPLDELKTATSVASTVLAQAWGNTIAQVITVLIVIAAIGSVFAGLLGGSRVPYEAARDKVFLPVFGRLHPTLNLPTAGVLTMGAITIIGSLFTLTTIINAAVATMVIIQSLAQVAAIVVLRRRQPNLPRPYRQWLYPIPTVIALVGWIYVYVSAAWSSIVLSLCWIAVGVVAYLVYARAERTWPFGPKEINEAFAGATSTAHPDHTRRNQFP